MKGNISDLVTPFGQGRGNFPYKKKTGTLGAATTKEAPPITTCDIFFGTKNPKNVKDY